MANSGASPVNDGMKPQNHTAVGTPTINSQLGCLPPPELLVWPTSGYKKTAIVIIRLSALSWALVVGSKNNY